MNLNIAKEWFQKHAALEADLEIGAGMSACHCIGPKNGQPVCPCRMRKETAFQEHRPAA